MRIIADENLHNFLILKLRDSGFNVLSIRESHAGISDVEVANLVKEEASILITEDKDFGELIFAHKVAKITVVFVRYTSSEINTISIQLMDVIKQFENLPNRYFITISKSKVRITEL